MEEGKEILKNLTEAFHHCGEHKGDSGWWNTAGKGLNWNPKSETKDNFTDRVKQLGDLFDKNE